MACAVSTAAQQCPATSVLATLDTPDFADGITVDGTTAYICDRSSGVHLVGIADPANPTTISTIDTPGDALDAAVGHNDRTLVAFGPAPALTETQLAVDSQVLFDPTEPIEVAALAEAVLGRRVKERLRARLPHSFVSILGLYVVFVA